jgi:hypothetical protein
MSFMGEVSDIGVADLLYLLALSQQSGRLSVIAAGEDVAIYLDQGKMALVTSANPSLRLGRMLIRLEFLTADALREVLDRQEQLGGSRALGTVLIENGLITEAQLHQCVEEQCIEVLSRIISAESGIFAFHPDVRVGASTEIVPLNSDRILVEAIRRTDEITRLRARLPVDTTPLTLSSAIDSDADTMTDTEIIIASALFGESRNLAELLTAVPVDHITLWRNMASMLDRGWVVPALTPAERLLQAVPVAAD